MGKKKKKDNKRKKKENDVDSRYLYDQSDVAYHEAGHAIAFIVYRTNFEHVDIKYRPDKGRGGHVNGKSEGIGYLDPFTRPIMYYCGEVAQAHKNKLKYRRDMIFSGGEHDNDFASWQLCWADSLFREIVYKNLPPTYHPCFRKLRDQVMLTAFKLVNNNWAQIELVAKELVVKRKLTYPQVLKLLIENNMYDNLIEPPRIKLEPPVTKNDALVIIK